VPFRGQNHQFTVPFSDSVSAAFTYQLFAVLRS